MRLARSAGQTTSHKRWNLGRVPKRRYQRLCLREREKTREGQARGCVCGSPTGEEAPVPVQLGGHQQLCAYLGVVHCGLVRQRGPWLGLVVEGRVSRWEGKGTVSWGWLPANRRWSCSPRGLTAVLSTLCSRCYRLCSAIRVDTNIMRGLGCPVREPGLMPAGGGGDVTHTVYSVTVFSALLPFYASPCSAVSRWWRIALVRGAALLHRLYSARTLA
jgi:hypothetical protein